jgi:hypothetical protein
VDLYKIIQFHSHIPKDFFLLKRTVMVSFKKLNNHYDDGFAEIRYHIDATENV